MSSKSYWPDISFANSNQPDTMLISMADNLPTDSISELNKREERLGLDWETSEYQASEKLSHSTQRYKAKGTLLLNVVKETFTHPGKTTVISKETGKIIDRS